MSGLGTLFSELIGLMDVRILAILLLSTMLGVIIGALPGLTATMGIALLTGLTYKISSEFTFAVLMGVYVGAIYGGSISAILLNIPGTGSAAATALDGHPLALQGRAEIAIRVTRLASVIGTFIGMVALALIAPLLTVVALMFTSPEYFMLALFGVLICGSIVSSDIPLKGWIGGLIGLVISMIGADIMQGSPRFIFGIRELFGGIALVPAMIGFYAVPEVIKAFSRETKDMKITELKESKKEKVSYLQFVAHNWRLIVQSSLIGIGIGALPGVGEDVAAWVAYGAAKKTSKTPEQFGTGCLEGAIAPEVANNSAIGGALIPMLTLAVPGSPPAAVMLGALLIHNIKPGPMIMRDNPTFIYYFAALLFLSVIALAVSGTLLARPMTKILKVPNAYLMPIVGALSIIGAYAINNRTFDIAIAVVFGVIGYLLDKMQYSPAPIIMGIILGGTIDENFRRSLLVSGGSLTTFITHPISLVFFIIILFVIINKIISMNKNQQPLIGSNIEKRGEN